MNEIWRRSGHILATWRAILAVLEPFIQHLVNQGLSRRTLKRHIDILWALGGEIISKVTSDPSHRKLSARSLVLDAIDEEGGPLLDCGFSLDDQESFDTTCRKLYRFLKSSA